MQPLYTTCVYCAENTVCLFICILVLNLVFFPVCVQDAHFYIGQQVTQSADIISATIRQDHVYMKRMQRATAAKTAPTVLLHTDHMTCAVLFMISGASRT